MARRAAAIEVAGEASGGIGPDAFARRDADRNAGHLRADGGKRRRGGVGIERLQAIGAARMHMQFGDA